ncbi:IS1/IS1595 family N-terminal zinc-binding domain-containing protein [Clostridium sp. UBA4395]
MVCPSQEVSRNGKYNNKQIYICKSCRKTFNENIYYI